MTRDPRDYGRPMCPIPGPGECLRERCHYWDASGAECTGSRFDSWEALESGTPLDPETPCVITFYEDYD